MPRLHDFTPAAGGISDPKSSLDFLFADGLLTRREYDAGRAYAEMFYGHNLRASAHYASCNQALDRVSAFAAGNVRTVVIGHKLLHLTSDVQLLRAALSYLAMHLEQIEIGLAERQPIECAAGTAAE